MNFLKTYPFGRQVLRDVVTGTLLLLPIMLGAAAAHLVVFKNSPAVPLVLLGLAAVVAWGRLAQTQSAVTSIE